MSQYWATNNLFSEAIKEVRNHYGNNLAPATEASLVAAYMNAASQSEIADQLDKLAVTVSRLPEFMSNSVRRTLAGP